jgi:phenylalanyl-tRNA synthetase beta chain
MLVSLKWLSDYVELKVPVEELENRFAMSGLNHESTTRLEDDMVVDLEVTSNRGDSLGHIGIAREAAVLFDRPLKIPQFNLPQSAFVQSSASLSVQNSMPDGCPRYTARVIRGVKVGPSPKWLVDRLAAVNIASVNNVVDATNYVMMECGQPLHAFDYAKLAGKKIIVRPGKTGEKFTAIDHREYELTPDTIVIADANGAVAIAGVMGGADSEINAQTTDIVIEAAVFKPLAVRRTARRLRLHSPSSYRFERRVDPLGLDWASLRCCQLILESAGGTLESTPLETNAADHKSDVVPLRASQVRRVLGIEIPWEQCLRILTALGCQCKTMDKAKDHEVAEVIVPSYRGDLPREIDLIEELARIWGYDKISEQTVVPTVRSAKRDKDILLDRVRTVMVGSGYCEVLTPSCVRDNLSQLLSVWDSGPVLKTITPMLEGASILRRSLVPSLLQAHLGNQSAHSWEVNLFETASVYLTNADNSKVSEVSLLSLVASHDYRAVKGTIEELITRCAPDAAICWEMWSNDAVEEGTGLQVFLDSELLGWIGIVSASVRSKLKLQGALVAAELKLDVLLQKLKILPKLQPINPHPLVERDLNFVLPEAVQWRQLTDVVGAIKEPTLRSVRYKETYRDVKRDGEGMKRVLIGLELQSDSQTLTTEMADAVVSKVVNAVESQSGGKLLGVGA